MSMKESGGQARGKERREKVFCYFEHFPAFRARKSTRRPGERREDEATISSSRHKGKKKEKSRLEGENESRLLRAGKKVKGK